MKKQYAHSTVATVTFRVILGIVFCILFAAVPLSADQSNVPTTFPEKIPTDTIKTAKGPVKVYFIGHASLALQFDKRTIYVDPFSRVADFGTLPPADFILITHHHGDHLDAGALKALTTPKTRLILTPMAAKKFTNGTVMANGDKQTVDGLAIEAVPAYNIAHKRESGAPFHPRGEGNGYIVTLGGKRIYIAGDSENTPEMKKLKRIHAAFLPMNLPYTMTPEMVVDAVKAFKPAILYPYHYRFGKTDLTGLETLMKGVKNVRLKIYNRPE